MLIVKVIFWKLKTLESNPIKANAYDPKESKELFPTQKKGPPHSCTVCMAKTKETNLKRGM